MDESQAMWCVYKINEYLSQLPWCDFEVMEYRGARFVVMGSMDISVPHIFEVWFERVSFMSLPMEWKTDASKPPLALVTGEDAATMNRRFRVERGHHVFRFTPEDYAEDFQCLVGAREVGFTVGAQ